MTCMQVFGSMVNMSTYAGLIHSTCSAIQVAEDAIADARSICLRQYGNAPSVSVCPLCSCAIKHLPFSALLV